MNTEADFWRDRYDVQHRKVHDMEDVIADLRGKLGEAIRLLSNATDPENAGDWDEAREAGWAFARKHED